VTMGLWARLWGMTDKQLYETREGEQLLTEIERRYGVCVEPGKNGHRTLTSKAKLDAQRIRPTGKGRR